MFPPEMGDVDVRHREVVPKPEASSGEVRRRFLLEAILDNLAAWAFIALAIAALFMVWATLVIVETYVGELPGVEP